MASTSPKSPATATPKSPATSTAKAKKPASKRVSVPPPGYKFVKVRKPDGTICTVQRKLTPEEVAAVEANQTDAAKQIAATAPKEIPETVKNDAAPKLDATKATTPVSPNTTTSSPTSNSESADHDTTKSEQAEQSREESFTLKEALEDQVIQNREKRTSRLRTSMIRGLANVISHSVPAIEIGDWHHGDEPVHHDDDPSEDDFDDDDDQGDGENMENDEHNGHFENNTPDEHGGTEKIERNHEPSGDDSVERHADTGPHDKPDVSNENTAESGRNINSGHNSTGGHTGNISFPTSATANALANAMTAPAPPAVAATNQINLNSNSATEKKNAEKITYSLNIKELEKLEAKAEEDRQQRRLKRHWSNISFYFLASLSIVLPLLFLILAIFIVLMNNKSVESHWHRMEQPIKVAVTAWPIVFAAVVAQVFKSFATYKVERGIKIRELEQLVSSNSFGSAMKQPLLLRRLDLLTLALFAIWCLSPIGSSALQRAYDTDLDFASDTPTVRYLDTTGHNRLFSPNGSAADDNIFATSAQIVAAYYQSALLPTSERDKATERKADHDQDRYDNPLIRFPNVTAKYQRYPYASAFGIPFNLPTNASSKDHAKDSNATYYEHLNFTMTASYFNFTCGKWTLRLHSTFDNSIYFANENPDFGMTMKDPAYPNKTDNQGSNYLAVASHNRIIQPSINTPNGSNGPFPNDEYSFIECTFNRVFVEFQVDCFLDAVDGLLPYCSNSDYKTTRAIDLRNDSINSLFPLEGPWVKFGGLPFDFSYTTPTEMFLNGGLTLDDPEGRNTSNKFNLSSTTSPADIQWYLGYLLNSWVSLGYCAECIDAGGLHYLPPDRSPLYLWANATREYVRGLKYVTNHACLSLYALCAAILFIAGVTAIVFETITVAPDVLGYASTVARGNRYLHLPKTSSAMNAAERARTIGHYEVMIQDVKANAEVGKIALGMRHDGAYKIRPDRVYR